MIRVIFYTRKNCALCDQTRADLEALQQRHPHQVAEIDLESDPELHQRYLEQIPVVQIGPYTLKAPINPTDLQVALAAAADGGHLQKAIEPRAQASALRINRATFFISRHWLAIFNLIVFFYLALPFTAPTLMKLGASGPARVIYTVYSPLCHQLAFRSWFLFGEQSAYPRSVVPGEFDAYQSATGNSSADLLSARAFLGNPQLGYKVALCERDIGIYAAILGGGLLFALLRKRLKPIPFWLWFALGIFPIALDGGSQLVSLMGIRWLDFLPPRESTPLLRSLTGGLFGLMNIWLAYPYVEESMTETRVRLAAKLAAHDSLKAGQG